MSFTVNTNGRLGNQIFRNLAVSIIAEKFDLFVDYSSYDIIKSLGIDLYIGKNKHAKTIKLTDDNYFQILASDQLQYNVYANNNYFQTKDITNMIYTYLHKERIYETIINRNQFKDRYNNNNDVFMHIRLTDVANNNPGPIYFLKVMSIIGGFDRIYIASDDYNHPYIKQITNTYPNSVLFRNDEVNTIKFGSTCKHIILSHGSFSAVIGYFAKGTDSFANQQSNIYYAKYDKRTMWYGDMFSINGYNCIEY